MKTPIQELRQLIEEEERVLVDYISLEDDNGRNIIFIENLNAENSDDSTMLETYSPYEALEFLENEGLLA
ncbi:hypothetical protein QLX41_gp010 [Listeria phage LMTA-94]|uniref:Uncharacterized protein n=8 Tax=Pecentumvirus TaxID=1857844 RepID=S4U803_9CAUD|nr:hypothetical protein QLX35_gp005 [Listeria phage LP-125]YP_009042997.1 hypothetical protein HH39_gp012 [Listeria phage LMSP-25]YP_009592534.1 hypothetical protein FDG78_gp005 [Listeria phage LP-064]YP_009616115.1 hypothetical protein FDI77_gp012 [Listeria phage LMTA-34]YP_009793339.1 hypothetical protein QLX42_gp036 [Listeria phage LMTA-57]YP_009793509.1 hypothetical protein QLX41_gp010 [Listeria phage LMTA-94]QIG60926.1 hypothetical protein vBLivaVAfA18_002 [Listeria phage vB_Liva_VAfA18]